MFWLRNKKINQFLIPLNWSSTIIESFDFKFNFLLFKDLGKQTDQMVFLINLTNYYVQLSKLTVRAQTKYAQIRLLLMSSLIMVYNVC